MSPPGTKKRLLIAYQLVGGLVVAAFVLVGIYRAESGIQNLFDGRGEDRVMAGDEVGELTILSTRHLVVRTSAIRDVVIGFVFMVGSLLVYQFIEQRIRHDWIETS
ncbi:MAG: hypothetical protein KJ064_14350 [Anaerolineae bacterium]|nr:hypothetical protein [Anaerolineae bacterium]